MLGVGSIEEVTMRKVGLIVAFLLLGTAHYGCGNEAVIVRGGDFVLTLKRLPVTKISEFRKSVCPRYPLLYVFMNAVD